MKKTAKSILSLLLAVVMIVGLLPVTAAAEETNNTTMVGTWHTDVSMSSAELGVDAPDSVLRCELAFAADGTVTADWTAVELSGLRMFFHQMFVSSYYALAYGMGITDLAEVEEFCQESTGMSVSAYMDTIVTAEAIANAFTPASTEGTYRVSNDATKLYLDMTLMGQVSDPNVANSCVTEGNVMKLNAASFGQSEYTFVCTRATNETVIDGIGFLTNVDAHAEGFDWETNGDRIIVPADEEVPEVGQIITFATEKAIRVESVQTVGGQTQITYSTPEMYEYLDYIDMEGNAQMDIAGFIPAEGVTVVSNSAAPMGLDDEFDIPSTEIDTGISTELELTIPLDDGWDLGVSVGIDVPTVAYKFDVDFDMNPFNDVPAVLVKDAFVKLEKELELGVSFGRGFDSDDEDYDDHLLDDVLEKKIDLGSVPLVGVNGLCIEVDLDLVFTAEGKAEITYTITGVSGVRIRNNRLERISELSSDTDVTLAGSASAGFEIGVEAEIFGENIFDIGLNLGVQADGEVNLRSTGMLCTDVVLFVYAHIDALQDCKIDDWLDIGVTITIWDGDNSPIRLPLHWENFVLVDDCTWDNGTILGTVLDADDSSRIQGALIEIHNNNNGEELAVEYSDANGNYSAFIDEGEVVVDISAEGYIPYQSIEEVTAREELYLESFLMVYAPDYDPENPTSGTIGGRITNAVNGSAVSNATLTIRRNRNVTEGEVVATTTTGSDGRYSIELPLGVYTILMERDGYITNHFNVAVTSNGNDNWNATMNPDGETVELGELRVVLTWGATPRDLDSHLWGPTVDGVGRFHTYYVDMSYYENGTRHAFLDVDDVSSYGPETTTVYDMTENGTYSFFVHDYTNYSGSYTEMAASGAKVEVYMGETLIRTFHVPTSGVGVVWHVFDFDAVTGALTPVNTFSTYVNGTSSVGSSANTYSMEEGERTYKDYELAEMAAVETEAPVVEETVPATEAPVVEETAPATEAPVVEETAPATEAPVVEETAPATEAPVVEETAPAAE